MNDNSTTLDWRLGQVKFFDRGKGFGFVKCFEDGQDYFIHISNVLSMPIEDNDFVVFKLMQSRKKPETLEARSLSKIEEFSNDTPFLFEQFLLYKNEVLRKKILEVLSSADVINLLEKEISSLRIIDTKEQYAELKKVIKLFYSVCTTDSMHESVNSVISFLIDKIASLEIRIRSWLDGILNNQPNNELLHHYFKTFERSEQLLIIQLLDTPSKEDLIQRLISNFNTQEILDLIIDHLKQTNNLNSSTNIISKLYYEKYWENKKDYNLFKIAINHIQEFLNKDEQIQLFLSGYLKTLSHDYIEDTCLDLTREVIEKLMENEVLSKTEKFNIIAKILAKEIEFFWSFESIPDQRFVLNATHEDWEKYDESRMEPFKWILDNSKHLTVSKQQVITNEIIKKLPEEIHVELWAKSKIQIIPQNSISIYLLFSENLLSDINKWLALKLITEAEIIEILKLNIHNQKEIKNRKEYYTLYNHLKSLANLSVDIYRIEDIIPQSNQWFYKIAIWLDGFSEEFYFDEFKIRLVYLSSDHQILFLKKLFFLAHSKKFNLTVEKLCQLTRIDFDIYTINQELNQELPLDISVDIVIEAIKTFEKERKFLLENELLSIVLKNLNFNKRHKFKISELFEKCSGRYEFKFNWNRDGEVKRINYDENKYYYAFQLKPGENVYEHNRRGDYYRFIPNEKFKFLKEAIKKIPGSKWNPKEEHWGVPSKYEKQVMQFAYENRLFLDFEGNKYANNIHLAKLNRVAVPNGIIFCEGRLANKKHQTFMREFWWCCNQPCFGNCETFHSSENWENYTLLDFLNILDFDLDDGNRVGDYIEKGKYYQFISTINRFNRFLERMYCEECGQILYPVEDSHFAYYRVTRFNCENDECSLFHKEVYLHHCLNGRCNNVIDSRKSKKCNNGLFICSNEYCGCCCSHNMFERRLNNLNTTDSPDTTIKQKILSDLKYKVENYLGHLEKAEHFCYKCGELMTEIENDIFKCQKCNIQYDVSKNNFKRPHRHLKNNHKSS